MSISYKGNRDLIKEMNHNLVLNLIKTHSTISQRSIAHHSGLSPATVSGIVAELSASGLIQEIGPEENTGRRGRRPVMISLNPQAGFVFGVKLMESSVAIALTDLEANIIYYQQTAFIEVNPNIASVHNQSSETIINVIIAIIEKGITASQVDQTKILGVGLGVSGLIDNEKGICRYSRLFPGHEDIDLVTPLAARFPFPIYIENDVKARTIAEQWFGHGHGLNHFVFICIGRGIGMGLVVNGQFYRGASNGAGEFGHIVMQEDGPPCECGKRGCLEAMASDLAIINNTHAAISQGSPSSLAHQTSLTIEDIIAAANHGDQLAQEMLAASGHLIGLALAQVVNLLNPQTIIIGGEGVLSADWRLNPLRAAIHQHAFHGLSDKLSIIIEPAGDETWARGAACVLLGERFTSPIYKQ